MDWFLYVNGLRHERVKETTGWKSVCKSRAVFRTQSSIYDEAFWKNN